ncbi:RHS repeat-associated core domain-containing protein [Kitasatospora sp. NPDC088783]|uniref:RHS repeat-associated core domain-containing protein n=1 Tax=Kitasatospora sp. NPDC088783 TaxID=3364077 RepID=UPI00380C76BC
MSNQIVRALEHGAQKLGRTLAEDAGKALKSFYRKAGDNLRTVAKNTREIEQKHVKDLEKILKGEGGDGVPHPRSGGGGRGSAPHNEGRGRERVADPHRPGRPPESRCQGGEPVDVATGVMFIEQQDVALPGALPLLFKRSYESDHRAGWWMGPAWACTFDERLEIDAEGVVHLTPDRTAQAYPHPAPGEPSQAGAGARLDLALAPDGGGYTLTDRAGGLVKEFTRRPAGDVALLTAVRDRSGHRVDLVHDADGVPLSLTHSGGYQVLVTVDGGRITALRLAGAGEEGRDLLLARYGYTDGHLSSVYDSSGKPLRFGNDAAGRITAWTDRNGTEYRYSYDARDRVTDEGAADGTLRFRFGYGEPDPDTGLRTTTETNALGHTTTYTVNERHQITAITDPLGNTTRFERDAHDRLLSRTDPLGRTTHFAHDGVGDLTAVTRPDGERSTAAYFGDTSLPTEITRPGGLTWRQTYDAAGRRTSVTEPTGATTRYRYDEDGHLAAVTDPLGHSTLVRCNPAGLPVEITDRDGATTRYRRDAFGRITAVTDPLGAVTRLEWTPEGRLRACTAPDGTTETWTYDDEGNLLVRTDGLGRATRYEYTPFETVAARTDPDGTRLVFDYDADMNLVAVTDPLGRRWSYAYDAAGRLVGERDFDGRTVGYQLDAAGQVVARTTPTGSLVRYAYDLLGQVVAKDVDGAATTYAYDPAGHLLRATGPDAEVLRTVDALGRVLTETVDGRTLTHTRDPLGRSVRRTTPAGHASDWAYDPEGRRTALATAAGTLEFRYDEVGRELERSLGERLTLASSWDTEHRLTGQILRSERDVLQRRDYAYRADGLLTGVDDRLNGLRTFEHDAADRVTAVRAEGWTESYAYDPVGNLTEADWPATGATEAARGTRVHTGTRLTAAGRVRYEHDAAGRTVLRQVTRLSRKPDTWHYSWDGEDRLTGVTTPDGTRWRYLYDPFGRRTAKHRLAADGVTVEERTEFTWDGSVLVEQTTSAPYLPGPHTLSWDHKGLQPLAQTETITDREQVDRRFFAIVTDLVGTPTELVDPATDTIAWRATPTVWGHTTWPGDSTTYTPLRFPGQYFDPETRLHYNLNRYYDPETARYTSPDPLGLSPAPNPHAYVHNPHTWADPLGLMPEASGDLKKELMELGKKRAQQVAAGLGEDETPPGAYTVGRDRTTGRTYYGESGPETGHHQKVNEAMPAESQRTDGRPPGVCGEPRMFTNAAKDGADPKNIDLVTVNTKGKKFKMCENCGSWVPHFGGEVLTG